MNIVLKKQSKTFGGYTRYYEHDSLSTMTKMNFSTFEPKEKGELDHCIIWLSGLTCTEDNFITKAGAQKFLAGTNSMIICPDTSPRGLNNPNEHESYDFGSGASFYVNATTEGYEKNYQMYDYIVKDLVDLVRSNFGINSFSIMGHSMGGHGALVIGLRESHIFKKISAFSPIVNPSNCPWGQKALEGYLGANKEEWKKYDATELLSSGVIHSEKILIDQGLEDEFLEKELLTNNFVEVAKAKSRPVEVNFREGYDHSYFFISSFIEDHIKFHLP
ncbi:S-formylglutathione hydrolase [Bacteriovorax sp. Seq25_V]|uniref:S-formylglutathione hydrolase n=1 Tax=Bacteriovorax sp. Seq25_V TaxID=1201288 RepID=UPI00038A2D30|nr:S-formylglutathione hydrolase [Bacteriovorax sp. Seq25_V]EQC45589.1 S-formylglutathione hydrolase [Bacteriovorax sp. Seq25_V]